MKFIKENIEMLVLLLLLIIGEYLHLFFHNEESSFVYFFLQQFGVLNLIPSIIIFRHVNTKPSKAIGLGIIIWNIKELLDEIVYYSLGYVSVFYPFGENKIEYIKILFITFIVLNSIVFYFKSYIWHFLYQYYCRLLPISLQLYILNIKKTILEIIVLKLKR